MGTRSQCLMVIGGDYMFNSSKINLVAGFATNMCTHYFSGQDLLEWSMRFKSMTKTKRKILRTKKFSFKISYQGNQYHLDHLGKIPKTMKIQLRSLKHYSQGSSNLHRFKNVMHRLSLGLLMTGKNLCQWCISVILQLLSNARKMTT